MSEWSHAKIGAALATKYSPPRYAYFGEVFHSVGGGRRADGLAIAMWRSLGLYIHGFEIKTSRTDWLREVKNPSKAEDVFQFCDFFWLAASDPAIVKDDDELPPDWGLMVPNGNALHVRRKATKLVPKPIERDFLCSILRLAYAKEISPPQLQAEYERGKTAGSEKSTWTVERLTRDVEELRTRIAEFEKASGVEIDKWSGADKIGEAVRQVLSGEHLRQRENLARLKEQAERIVANITKELTFGEGG
jgi:hypothetical protein